MATTDPETRPLIASAKAVLRTLANEGPATRPQIGAALGLSRPTMSAAIAELERWGYVEMVGVVQSAVGRRAARYRVGRGAGHVIAVDAGSTHVRLRVATLDRRVVHSRIHRLPASQRLMTREISHAVADEVAGALAAVEPEWGALRTVGIALPTRVVGPDGNAAATRQDLIFSAFEPPADVALVLENNVNCAAVAEQLYGAARGFATFAYVQVGFKIGMGLILGNQLVRGRNGAAGEIGHLTFPFAPGLTPEPGEIERHIGTDALIERVRAAWPGEAGAPPVDTAELLARAAAGEGAARDHVDRHADEIGAIVAACVSVVDPGLIVLGGGVGSAPQLLPRVSEVANRLAYPVALATSLLGADATVLGIEKLAVDRALDLLLRDRA